MGAVGAGVGTRGVRGGHGDPCGRPRPCLALSRLNQSPRYHRLSVELLLKNGCQLSSAW